MDFFEYLERDQFLPLIPCEPETARQAAEFFSRQGIRSVEIPMRSEKAVATIKLLKKEFSVLTVVAGTVLRAEQAAAAADAGASALVSPGWDETVAESAAACGLSYIPGVFTATEVQNAFRNGCRYLKFFPAAAAGIEYLCALSAPFYSAGVRFMPTGGINHRNYRQFLEIPSVFCVAGSDFEPVFTRDDSE